MVVLGGGRFLISELYLRDWGTDFDISHRLGWVGNWVQFYFFYRSGTSFSRQYCCVLRASPKMCQLHSPGGEAIYGSNILCLVRN